MMTAVDISEHIAAFAKTISTQQLGLARHAPERWAQHTRCFENVIRKVKEDGGRGQSGWMFQYRIVADIPGPGYLIAVHHAVWHAPSGHLIDVTPFHPEKKLHPYCPGDGVLFLVDENAPPVVTERMIAPRPSRFFALDQNERLAAHVQRLGMEEVADCQRIYDTNG